MRRLRCFAHKQRHAQCRAGLGQGAGHTLKNVHTTNHQSPITNHQSRDVSRYVFTICFTICLFISPDLDGHRAPKNGSVCFTVCGFLGGQIAAHNLSKSSFRLCAHTHPSVKSREEIGPSTQPATCPLHTPHRPTHRPGAASSLLPQESPLGA